MKGLRSGCTLTAKVAMQSQASFVENCPLYLTCVFVFFFSRYVLLGGDEGRFRVEHDTGVIKVRRLLDDVVVPRVYTLEIEAHDKGRARLRATAVVKLKVVDKETPIFDQLSYVNVVAENVRVGAEISRVQARSPGGSGIFYTITEGDPLNQFSIDLKTGNVV